MSERTYTNGVPVAVTVHDDGRVVVEVDLTDLLDSDLVDTEEGYWPTDADRGRLNEVSVPTYVTIVAEPGVAPRTTHHS